LKKITAFFQIIRWQNLVFIAIAQVLFHYCILKPNLAVLNEQPKIKGAYLLLMIVASILIAAGGNIINDYFDLNIDKINKPHKLIIEKYISRRYAIFLHLTTSLAGIMCSVYVAHKLNLFWLGIANTITVLVLFIYSASLKKKFLIGNIIVSALTAWVIMVLALPEYEVLLLDPFSKNEVYNKMFRLGILYASFSFIISVIREVIKDMEDVEGDRRNGCKTMPIVLGLNATKAFVAVWLIVIIALLVIAQIYVIRFKWWLSIGYSSIFLIIPLSIVFKRLFAAQTPTSFHQLSSIVKWIMLAGIASMLFFKMYS